MNIEDKTPTPSTQFPKAGCSGMSVEGIDSDILKKSDLPRNIASRFAPGTFEPKWREYWEQHQTFKTQDPLPGEKKFFCLDMFPYPSGTGLHVGHPVGYVASDVLCRMLRMQGFKVLHPMGWDAFGLPAEQHAIKTGRPPAETTRENSAIYKRQMDLIGLSYDWSREVSTASPDFYKWTQYIFTKLWDSYFDPTEKRARPISELPIPEEVRAQGAASIEAYKSERRLVYYADIPVNWCPALGTVLANEEVFDGKSEHGHPVVRMPMRQLVMRITAYADRLLDGLQELDWSENIKEQQRRWIGRTAGVEFKVQTDQGATVTTFSSRPELIAGSTLLSISPEHPLVSTVVKSTHQEGVDAYVREAQSKSDLTRISSAERTGVFTGSYAINPITGGAIPIYVADYLLTSNAGGVAFGVPAHDLGDATFAEAYRLDVAPVCGPAEARETSDGKFKTFCEEGKILNNEITRRYLEPYIGLSTSDARAKMIEDLCGDGKATAATTYRLRDWIFSRQRYWGEPIPLIHWEDGQIEALSVDQLPLILPQLEDYRPTGDGQSALARAGDWVDVVDEKTGRRGQRETLTMPQWAGSSWYPLRFMDPKNESCIVDEAKERAWGQVDYYVGGAEHAVLHLLYSRFWFQALNDLGVTTVKEPFKKLFNQGMLLAPAFENTQGVKVPSDEVIERAPGQFAMKDSGVEVRRIMAKMSKSLRNTVSPDTVVNEFGADSFRVCLMFMGPVDGERHWDTASVTGAHRFLKRVYGFATENGEREIRTFIPAEDEPYEVGDRIQQALQKVTADIKELKHNTAIAELMKTLNDIEEQPISKSSFETYLKMLSPFAPFLGEELWSRLGHSGSISHATWPTSTQVEAPKARHSIEIVVQVNGRKRGTISVPSDAVKDEVKAAALQFAHGFGVPVEEETPLYFVFDQATGAPKLVNVASR